MANLTIVVDDQVLRRARIKALEHGTSVNAVLRDYLASFAGENEAASALRKFLDLAERSQVTSGPRERWSRDDLYDRPVMRHG